jgi:hypothetical protein
MVYKKCSGVGTSIIKNKQHCCGVRLSDVLRHEPNHGAKIDNISKSRKFLSDYFMFLREYIHVRAPKSHPKVTFKTEQGR